MDPELLVTEADDPLEPVRHFHEAIKLWLVVHGYENLWGTNKWFGPYPPEDEHTTTLYGTYALEHTDSRYLERRTTKLLDANVPQAVLAFSLERTEESMYRASLVTTETFLE